MSDAHLIREILHDIQMFQAQQQRPATYVDARMTQIEASVAQISATCISLQSQSAANAKVFETGMREMERLKEMVAALIATNETSTLQIEMLERNKAEMEAAASERSLAAQAERDAASERILAAQAERDAAILAKEVALLEVRRLKAAKIVSEGKLAEPEKKRRARGVSPIPVPAVAGIASLTSSTQALSLAPNRSPSVNPQPLIIASGSTSKRKSGSYEVEIPTDDLCTAENRLDWDDLRDQISKANNPTDFERIYGTGRTGRYDNVWLGVWIEAHDRLRHHKSKKIRDIASTMKNRARAAFNHKRSKDAHRVEPAVLENADG